MQLFYAPDIHSERFQFDKVESNHCLRVLRKQLGEELLVTDGQGKLVRAEIVQTTGKICELQVVEVVRQESEQKMKTTLAVAFPKNNSRCDWMIEKAVELGVTSIVPLTTYHSERKKINTDRANKIAMAAMKQSLRLFLPTVEEPIALKHFIKQLKESSGNKLLADAGATTSLKHVTLHRSFNTIMIGPEGDFSAQEKEDLLNAECQSFHLGTHRLRTETAAITALASLSILMEE